MKLAEDTDNVNLLLIWTHDYFQQKNMEVSFCQKYWCQSPKKMIPLFFFFTSTHKKNESLDTSDIFISAFTWNAKDNFGVSDATVTKFTCGGANCTLTLPNSMKICENPVNVFPGLWILLHPNTMC